MTDQTEPMSRADRQSLIQLSKARAKQSERDAESQEKILLAELQDLLTAEFEAHDRLWAEAVIIAADAVEKANAQVRAQCADLGIPAEHAPKLQLGWRSRSEEFGSGARRAELRKLAEARAAALKSTAKAEIQRRALNYQERVILGGLSTDEAREASEAMPTVAQLMPALSLDDLGVKRWQPPEDAAAQLATPLTPAGRRRRQILRAIEANPGKSDRAIAVIAGCDHKTVAAHRDPSSGEFPAITGDLPTDDPWEVQNLPF